MEEKKKHFIRSLLTSYNISMELKFGTTIPISVSCHTFSLGLSAQLNCHRKLTHSLVKVKELAVSNMVATQPKSKAEET